MHRYRKKAVVYLLIFLILFLISFFVAYWSLKNGRSVLNLGFPYKTEGYTIMALSIIGVIVVIYEIITVEHHKEFEERIKS